MIEPISRHRLACLPMYDLPELHAAHEALCTAIAARLQAHGMVDIPTVLTRNDDLLSLWRDPDLLLGQTCGYPLMTSLVDQVQVVATPIYAAAGCAGAAHRSAIVVGAASDAIDLDDLHGTVCAVNGFDSNTGMNLLRAMLAPLAREDRFFAKVTISGSHRESLRMVAAGHADIAAVDCVTLALLSRIEPALTSKIRILDWSPISPSLPFITANGTDASTIALLQTVLMQIAGDPDLTGIRNELLLDGFEFVPLDTYARVLSLEVEAISQGYPNLV